MKSKNIYDTLFNVYENSTKQNIFQTQVEFENELDSILGDNYELYKNTMNDLHNLLEVVGKEYYISGIKTALELFRS